MDIEAFWVFISTVAAGYELAASTDTALLVETVNVPLIALHKLPSEAEPRLPVVLPLSNVSLKIFLLEVDGIILTNSC